MSGTEAATHHGGPEVAVLTLAFATANGWEHAFLPECKFIAFASPQEGLVTDKWHFLSMRDLAIWIRETQPCKIEWGVAPGEDIKQLASAVRELAHVSVH